MLLRERGTRADSFGMVVLPHKRKILCNFTVVCLNAPSLNVMRAGLPELALRTGSVFFEFSVGVRSG